MKKISVEWLVKKSHYFKDGDCGGEDVLEFIRVFGTEMEVTEANIIKAHKPFCRDGMVSFLMTECLWGEKRLKGVAEHLMDSIVKRMYSPCCKDSGELCEACQEDIELDLFDHVYYALESLPTKRFAKAFVEIVENSGVEMTM